MIALILAIGTCGFSSIAIYKGCCKSSLDPRFGSMMTSEISILQSQSALQDWTPSTAIGHSYCQVDFVSLNGNGYSQTKFLLDDGNCRGSWKCSNGQISISNSTSECMGTGSDFENLDTNKFSDILNSSVVVGNLNITTGNQIKIWTGYYPLALNVIYVRDSWTLFSAIFIALCMCSSVVSCLFIIFYRIENVRKRKLYVPIVILQTLIFGTSVLVMIYYYKAQSEIEYLILLELVPALQAFSSLLVNVNNIKLLFKVFKGLPYLMIVQRNENFVYIVLVIVHLVLAWPWYVSYFTYELVIAWY